MLKAIEPSITAVQAAAPILHFGPILASWPTDCIGHYTDNETVGEMRQIGTFGSDTGQQYHNPSAEWVLKQFVGKFTNRNDSQ